MNTVPALALAGLLAASLCSAAEPPTTSKLSAATTAAGVKAELDASATPSHVRTPNEAAARSLQARYPLRPAVFHADGSVSQYLGASRLLQTVVRLDGDGKIEKLCTTDRVAAKQFAETPRSSATQAVADGEKP